MANESTAQLPLTRRELRELERQAEREVALAKIEAEARAALEAERQAEEARIAAEAARLAGEARLAEEARAAAEAARIVEEARAAEAAREAAAAIEPVFLSRRQRREAEFAAIAEFAAAEAAAVEPAQEAEAQVAEIIEPVAVAESAAVVEPVEVVAPEAPAAPAVPAAEPVFLSRRERREAERAALARLEDESAVAAARVVAELPELFAVAAPVTEHGPQPAPIAVEAAPKRQLAPIAAETAPEPQLETAATERILPVVELDVERALRRPVADALPLAPVDEPELEVAAAFARQGRAARDSRARRIILSNRRSSSAGRFGGSMVAMSFLAGTVVLGAGSAAAIGGAIGAQQGEVAQAPEAASMPEPQKLTVGITDTLAVSAPRADEATAVTSIGTAAAANLATGVKLPDSKAYTNDITANVQYPFPMGVQITDTYGPRISPTAGASSWHGGVDFTPGESTPVGSIADGVVIAVDSASATTYGNFVEVQHLINGVRVTSIYAHLETNSIGVKAGDTISVGDQLGTVGTTGASTGPHLHLEVRIDGDKRARHQGRAAHAARRAERDRRLREDRRRRGPRAHRRPLRALTRSICAPGDA